MAAGGLIIGIDYANEYCQACYYNFRHERPESISASVGDDRRYIIPNAICYSPDAKDWLIGSEALEYSDLTGAYLFEHLLENHLRGEVCKIDDMDYTYAKLLMLYLGRLIEKIRAASGMQTVEKVTVSLPRTNKEIKEIFADIFKGLSIPDKNVKILNSSESYAYYMLEGDPELWRNGSIMFDLGPDGLYARFLTISGPKEDSIVYVNEKHNFNIADRDVADPMSHARLDRKFKDFYDEVREDYEVSSVFLSGIGFYEPWYNDTLRYISANKHVYRGNNIRAKGACLFSFRAFKGDKQDYPIICTGRTRVDISVDMRFRGKITRIDLSRAAVDWYDADSSVDVITDETDTITFYITSIISRETVPIELSFSSFPKRPNKATRLEITVRYRNNFEVDLIVKDKGFGDIFPATDSKVQRRLNLEEFI